MLRPERLLRLDDKGVLSSVLCLINSLSFCGAPVGPGVYDVHSPAVPPVDALRSKIKQFVDTGVLSGHPERLWINPDCGLKTRDWVEVRRNLLLCGGACRWGSSRDNYINQGA